MYYVDKYFTKLCKIRLNVMRKSALMVEKNTK